MGKIVTPPAGLFRPFLAGNNGAVHFSYNTSFAEASVASYFGGNYEWFYDYVGQGGLVIGTNAVGDVVSDGGYNLTLIDQYAIRLAGVGGQIGFNDGYQCLAYDDGSNTAQIFPYSSADGGMTFYGTGKYSFFVDSTLNFRLTSSDSQFLLPANFAQTTQTIGRATVQAGTGASYCGVGGSLGYSVTQTGSVTGGATDAWIVTIPGNTLDSNGDSLTFEFTIFAANTANNKQCTVAFGGTTIGDVTSTSAQNEHATIRGMIVRQSATHCYCAVHCDTLSKWVNFVTYTDVTATLSNSQTFKVVFAAATANNDILFRVGKINWEPVP